MSNLHVSCLKIPMFLLLVLTMFYSCSNDTDLFTEVIESRTEESLADEPIPSIAIATPTSGFAPLEVTLEVGDLASKTFAKYEWKFKDGSKISSRNVVHTFKEVGKHSVELTATDQEGQVLTDSVSVTVMDSESELPVAIASANILTGDAPLNVNFTGSDSWDDKGIASYFWNFSGGSSSASNTSTTFSNPGVYNVTLTVTDDDGQQDTASLTINVTQEPIIDPGCTTNGGKANETGLKTWCWGDINVPSGADGTRKFSNDEFTLAIECNPSLVTRVNDKLRFYLDPVSPAPQSWCSNDYNMRAEISTMPWQVNHPLGTEEWMGWSYTFGDDYKIDSENPWLFFQMQQGVNGSPPHELAIVPSSLYGANNGEVVVINKANKTETDRTRTGIVPTAGTTLDIVVHVVHNLGSDGLLQVWINGNKVYDKQVGTVHDWAPWGGNAKFGIYKWPWRDTEGVQSSQQQGISNLETFMGPLRIITRRPGDANYGKNSFAEVVPR